MLLIVDLATTTSFPAGTVQEVDSAITTLGFKKQVQSTIKPGKELSLTYEGPTLEKARVEEILRRLAEENQFTFSVDVEESVRFP